MGIQQNHWIYRSPFGFVVSKMPTWFDHQNIKYEGDEQNGRFSINSYREFDNEYKAEAKIYIE